MEIHGSREAFVEGAGVKTRIKFGLKIGDVGGYFANGIFAIFGGIDMNLTSGVFELCIGIEERGLELRSDSADGGRL